MLLPYYTFEALADRHSEEKSRNASSLELGTANTLGWMAYRIFDDVMDNDIPHAASGVQSALLPLANICLREAMLSYLSAIDHSADEKESRKFLLSIFDRMDKANAREQRECRFHLQDGCFRIPESLGTTTSDIDDYARVAEKSLGHALGTICPLILTGHSPGPKRCVLSWNSSSMRSRHASSMMTRMTGWMT